MFLIIYLFIIFKTWKCLTQHRLVSVDSCIITLTLIPDDETTEHVLDSEKKLLKNGLTYVISLSRITLA